MGRWFWKSKDALLGWQMQSVFKGEPAVTEMGAEAEPPWQGLETSMAPIFVLTHVIDSVQISQASL